MADETVDPSVTEAVDPGVTETVDPGVTRALRAVFDPCCRDKGISVVDMGLLHRARVEDGVAHVELLLTTGWCPFASRVLADVETAVAGLPSVERADVRVVWDEAWDSSRLSAEARRKLRFMPDPAQVPDRAAFVSAHWARNPHPTKEDRHDR
jgi:metal-sulfur cluster biosynthetic enzyme